MGQNYEIIKEAERVEKLLDDFLNLVYCRLYNLNQKTFHFGDSEYVSEWVYRALGTECYADVDLGLAKQIQIISLENNIEFLNRFEDVEFWTNWTGTDYRTRVVKFENDINLMMKLLNPDLYHFFEEVEVPYTSLYGEN